MKTETPKDTAQAIVAKWKRDIGQVVKYEQMESDIEAALKERDERAAKIAETPYSDEVAAFGTDQPRTVGQKIAAAIRGGQNNPNDEEVYPNEEWRPIGHPDLVGRYLVSNYGRVKGLVNRGGRILTTPRFIKPKPVGSYGHLLYSLAKGNKPYGFLAGRLVLLTFVGPPSDPSFEASHLDGNARNNQPHNLVWESHTDNVRRQAEHGTKLFGSKVSGAKLTEGTVKEFRRRNERGEAIRVLAHEAKLSYATVYNAVRGKTWKHVTR